MVSPGIDWTYYAGDGKIDMGTFSISCKLAAQIAEAYKVRKPRPTTIFFCHGNILQAFAGALDENRVVWDEVKVIKGPNSQVEGRVGFVNSKYLSCKWYDEHGNLIREDP